MFEKLYNVKQNVCVFVLLVISIFFFSNYLNAQIKEVEVSEFDGVVISPHIEVVFRAGEKEAVSIESIVVPIEKLNVHVEERKLKMYLEGAKISSGKTKVKINNKTTKKSKYKGTIVKAIVTYKKLNFLDLRGEERMWFEGDFIAPDLKLNVYGKSHVTMNKVAIHDLKVSMYGESYLEILEGKIENQKFTAYGESRANTLNVENKETKITAYGDGVFQFNVEEALKISSYGSATINYSGSPDVSKGLIIGETRITNVNF